MTWTRELRHPMNCLTPLFFLCLPTNLAIYLNKGLSSHLKEVLLCVVLIVWYNIFSLLQITHFFLKLSFHILSYVKINTISSVNRKIGSLRIDPYISIFLFPWELLAVKVIFIFIACFKIISYVNWTMQKMDTTTNVWNNEIYWHYWLQPWSIICKYSTP